MASAQLAALQARTYEPQRSSAWHMPLLATSLPHTLDASMAAFLTFSTSAASLQDSRSARPPDASTMLSSGGANTVANSSAT